MKFNDVELAELSMGEAVLEGRLHHKRTGGNRGLTGFKERWFKLRFNVLFYFNLSDTGTILDKKPAGAIVLEYCSALYEPQAETPFTFSLTFRDEKDRKHMFSGRSDDCVNNWISAINLASYENWRNRLQELQMQLSQLTGQDPLLMFYRSEGSKVPTVSEDSVPNEGQMSYNKTSFRSYIGPGAAKAEQSSRVLGSDLHFQDDYFGNDAQSQPYNGGKRREHESDLDDLGSSFFHVSVDDSKKDQRCPVPKNEQSCSPAVTSSAIARPRPMRKAPEPPTRPPRGQKVNPPTPNVNTNLIDL